MAYAKLQRGTLRGERCEGTHHNFREFDTTQADHINDELVQFDEFFDLTDFDGELMPLPSDFACEGDLIHKVYSENYAEGLALQNAMYVNQGHKERCKTLEKLEHGKQTRPMEYIFQLGNMHNHPTGDELKTAFEQYLTKLLQYCKENNVKCHLISAALHVDEKTPHIHYKVTFSADLSRGGQLPRQEECFRQSKLELPNPAQKEGRYNNRLMTFTEHCRELELEVFRGLGYEIETKPRPNMRHLKTRDYYTQAAINKEKDIREQIDRINAKYAAERSEIAQNRLEVENMSKSLDSREKSISERERLVKLIQDNNNIILAGQQYDILDILKGLEDYNDAEVSKYIDQFTGFIHKVAEQGRTELQVGDLTDSTEDEDWDDKR